MGEAEDSSQDDPLRIPGDIHRIGGGNWQNLRLKPAEAQLRPPGISVLKGGSAQDVLLQVKSAFPNAGILQAAARVIGTITEEAIRKAGFDLIPDPTRKFPNHYRLVHPDGVSGFNNDNLARLSEAFTDTAL